MDGIVVEYRDPILGIISIFIIVFLASFLTYTYNIFTERQSRKEYRKLLKKFEIGDLKEDDYIHLYTTYNLPFDSIILLASSFLHQGNYNKAISVYLALLEHVKDPIKKEELLELLGSTYYKGGFLQRSERIFLNILKFSPHNIFALKNLLLIYESLKNYDKCIEVLSSLEELDEDIGTKEVYIKALMIIDDAILTYDERSSKLLSMMQSNKIIERLTIEFLLHFNKNLFWQQIDIFDLSKAKDLLWYLDFNDIDFEKVNQNAYLKNLYSAKSYINDFTLDKSFEINILNAINNSSSKIPAGLSFSFTCTSCKHVQPIYLNRCPHCNSILSLNVNAQITKVNYEKNQSLQ
jgi:tetratricopeptide (TPR) repeat protein